MTHVRCPCARSTDCRKCDGLGFVPDPFFGDLTTDEVRVITGLVRAMRSDRIDASATLGDMIMDAESAMDDTCEHHDAGRPDAARTSAASAAWHIAHAISQMGES